MVRALHVLERRLRRRLGQGRHRRRRAARRHEEGQRGGQRRAQEARLGAVQPRRLADEAVLRSRHPQPDVGHPRLVARRDRHHQPFGAPPRPPRRDERGPGRRPGRHRRHDGRLQRAAQGLLLPARRALRRVPEGRQDGRLRAGRADRRRRRGGGGQDRLPAEGVEGARRPGARGHRRLQEALRRRVTRGARGLLPAAAVP